MNQAQELDLLVTQYVKLVHLAFQQHALPATKLRVEDSFI